MKTKMRKALSTSKKESIEEELVPVLKDDYSQDRRYNKRFKEFVKSGSKPIPK